MPAYQVTATPHSSLFLARERGNRAYRRSFSYIPASTASGALNSRLYQIGWDDLMHTFRFSNLYAAYDDDHVWLPAPRTLFRCPACSQVTWMQCFDPASMVGEMICQECGVMRRPARGFVAVRLTHDSVIHDGPLRERILPLSAQLSGRVALHRNTGGQVDGRLHFVEVLRARGVPFRGSGWVEQSALGTLAAGQRFRLTMGGLRSRGCGRVTLEMGTTNAAAEPVGENDLLLVETPVLPLPESLRGNPPVLTARAVSPYARVEVCERWAAKQLKSSKGLVSFLDVLAVGSVVQVTGGTTALWPGLFFYWMEGTRVDLHYIVPQAFPNDPVIGDEYTIEELWTLGFGQLKRLVGSHVA